MSSSCRIPIKLSFAMYMPFLVIDLDNIAPILASTILALGWSVLTAAARAIVASSFILFRQSGSSSVNGRTGAMFGSV